MNDKNRDIRSSSNSILTNNLSNISNSRPSSISQVKNIPYVKSPTIQKPIQKKYILSSTVLYKPRASYKSPKPSVERSQTPDKYFTIKQETNFEIRKKKEFKEITNHPKNKIKTQYVNYEFKKYIPKKKQSVKHEIQTSKKSNLIEKLKKYQIKEFNNESLYNFKDQKTPLKYPIFKIPKKYNKKVFQKHLMKKTNRQKQLQNIVPLKQLINFSKKTERPYFYIKKFMNTLPSNVKKNDTEQIYIHANSNGLINKSHSQINNSLQINPYNYKGNKNEIKNTWHSQNKSFPKNESYVSGLYNSISSQQNMSNNSILNDSYKAMTSLKIDEKEMIKNKSQKIYNEKINNTKEILISPKTNHFSTQSASNLRDIINKFSKEQKQNKLKIITEKKNLNYKIEKEVKNQNFDSKQSLNISKNQKTLIKPTEFSCLSEDIPESKFLKIKQIDKLKKQNDEKKQKIKTPNHDIIERETKIKIHLMEYIRKEQEEIHSKMHNRSKSNINVRKERLNRFENLPSISVSTKRHPTKSILRKSKSKR